MSIAQEKSDIRWFENLTSDETTLVGGKNASLGEMIRTLKEEGVDVPDGFATTADTYRQFLKANNLTETIQSHLKDLQSGAATLEKVGKSIRRLFWYADFPEEMTRAIQAAYTELSRHYGTEEVDVAVRSSATAEDLPQASFAGQQETFLNVTGSQELLEACRKCYASLFTDRAISYREAQGFDHMKIALSIGVQKMVRSDHASAGVMFSLDTDTGFPDLVVINAAWGLGENVVQGSVTPDEYRVFKPLLQQPDLKPVIEKKLGSKEKKMVYAQGGSETTKNVDTSSKERRSFVLNDDEILQLARWASAIEAHYQQPMDLEWAKDGQTGELFIVQARPETVQSQKKAGSLKTYTLKEKSESLLTGLSIGGAIAASKACIIPSAEEKDRFEDGSILVAEMTDPDWVPIMERAAGIITERGGRTSHAAIVSRELGIPAVVGTGEAIEVLEDTQEITISCAEGDRGYIYKGSLDFEESEVNLEEVPKTQTQIMMNIASPDAAFRWWQLPCDGIGLARMEFLINNVIQTHPMALVHFDNLPDEGARKQIQALTRGYEDKTEYFVDHLSRGIAKIAAAQYPNPVIVRTSDFKTNEYAQLIGGQQFEPAESNPMLGFRGASRYYSDRYREGFALECRALHRVREVIGLSNVIIMIPFCRTLEEADQVLEVLAENGLKRGENGLQVYLMCEIPSNVELAAEFSQRFDGFSIGSNDLTQLVLGVDRDSEALSHLFDERDPAVKQTINRLIPTAHTAESKVGICGQAPSDYPDFAAFLVEAGIDSISLNPDSVVAVKRRIAEMEG
ncbi:MAG: phosphoenolpyruvate synthase [Cyanobacteria bacterium QS_7_48_42]|nr:MAG: phosphoenolpyruvate synthase [Cyanobacteria bacterium QS_7_48_42]